MTQSTFQWTRTGEDSSYWARRCSSASGPMESAAKIDRTMPRFWHFRTAFIALVIGGWDGFPYTIAGLPLELGKYLLGLIACGGLALRIGTWFRFNKFFDAWELWAMALFALCVMVSAFSNTFFFPQPLSGWIYATYVVTPILLVIPFRQLKCNAEDAINALYILAIVASILVIVNKFHHLSFMVQYERDSGFGTLDQRIVFLKLQTAAGLTIALTRLFRPINPVKYLVNALVLAILVFNLFVVSESRLAIAAVLIGATLGFILLFNLRQRMLAVLLATTAAVSIMPFIFQKYSGNFESVDRYTAQDPSITYRLKEKDHFEKYFNETYGLGFGYMSRGGGRRNILAISGLKGGYDAGAGDYGMGVDDIGIFSALYQFGYAGILLVLGMTFAASWSMIKLARRNPCYLEVGMIGCLMLAFMLSPWPMNPFTLEYSANFGGVVWFIAAEAAGSQKHLYQNAPACTSRIARSASGTRRNTFVWRS